MARLLDFFAAIFEPLIKTTFLEGSSKECKKYNPFSTAAILFFPFVYYL